MRMVSGLLAATLMLLGPAVSVPQPEPDIAFGTMPEVIPREVWGAREPSCEWAGTDGNRITHAVVHHTYEPTGEPSIESAYEALQHIQNLHMDDNSWCDIGYSYLVDWFGNVYEGARGTIERPITSAHTSGLNFEGAGIALIGRYQVIEPTDAAIEAAGRIAGWALGWYGIESDQDVQLTVGGANNKFASGARITVPAITAHRDVVNTECPGDAAYGRLAEVRAIAEQVTAAMQANGEFGRGSGGVRPIFAIGAPVGPMTPDDAEEADGPDVAAPEIEAANGVSDDASGADADSDESASYSDDNAGSNANYVAQDDGETLGEETTFNLWWIAALAVAAAAFLWWWLNRRNRENL